MPPEALAEARKSPQSQESKDLFTRRTPAYPRLAPKSPDRPVTPEVAGSSPVAPMGPSDCYRLAC
jgi:hypothetical protein